MRIGKRQSITLKQLVYHAREDRRARAGSLVEGQSSRAQPIRQKKASLKNSIGTA
jgi:hypothetical protein